MLFTKTLAFLACTAAVNVQAQTLSPGENVILAVDAVTFISQKNLEVANNLTEENVLEQAGLLVENFGAIVKAVTGSLSNITLFSKQVQTQSNGGSVVGRASKQVRQFNPSVIPEVDQHAICNTFRSFVLIHQQLLSIVIGEKGLLSTTPFTAPLGTVLRSLEGVVDTFAFAVIGLVPTCSAHATQANAFLSPTLSDAANTYP